MLGVVSHTLINVDSFTRTGECRICGPVTVRRRGSGTAPWRCETQVNEYQRQQTKRVHDECRNSSALRVVARSGCSTQRFVAGLQAEALPRAAVIRMRIFCVGPPR